MVKFAANLSMMFNELDFLDRNGLVQALFNMPPGDWESGERDIAALPGRQSEFGDGVGTAIEYADRLGCRQLHAMAGIPAKGAAPEKCMETYVDNLRFAAEVGADNLFLQYDVLHAQVGEDYLAGTVEGRGWAGDYGIGRSPP